MRKPNNSNNNRPRRNGGHNSNHNNNQSSIHSLNYKFDSTSIAGKFSDTALNLIKRYNDLARDAYSNSDIVSAEVYKQYAEHYRKILTEINEARNAISAREVVSSDKKTETSTEVTEVKEASQNVEEKPVVEEKAEKNSRPKQVKPRELKVVEIKPSRTNAKEDAQKEVATLSDVDTKADKPKKVYRRKPAPKAKAEVEKEVAVA